jgi:ethanolamine utilization protein EutP (predicted NTPase)
MMSFSRSGREQRIDTRSVSIPLGWMGVEEEVDLAQEDIILAACWLLLAVQKNLFATSV